MKIWIVYDTKYGNNRQVATWITTQLQTHHEVHCATTKEISPKAVIASAPDAFLFGGPRRIGKISFTLRRWVERFARLLKSHKISLKKVGAWETRGEMKESATQSTSKMERNIYEINLKTGALWQTLIQKIPVLTPPLDLLSLVVIGGEDGQMDQQRLEPTAEAKVTDFLKRFEAL